MLINARLLRRGSDGSWRRESVVEQLSLTTLAALFTTSIPHTTPFGYKFVRPQIVEANLGDENFGVNELAEKAGLSRSQVHRKLKSTLNKSISQFIRDY